MVVAVASAVAVGVLVAAVTPGIPRCVILGVHLPAAGWKHVPRISDPGECRGFSTAMVGGGFLGETC